MGRFLIFFSYIGTSYNGLQRQLVHGVVREGTVTIQGALEEALSVLKPANEVKLSTSSRTDAGVHALSNSAHFDLKHRHPDREFSPLLITAVLNQTLYRRDHDIRVLQTRRVSDDFHSRFYALSRHYVYRMAVVKNSLALHWANPHSAMESKRSLMVLPPFDINRLHEAARVFSGRHDFSAYTNPSMLSVNTHINPVKTLSVGVRRGQHFMSPHQSITEQDVELWEIHVSSSSFLYKQVRRMVGVMIRCASGEVTTDDIRQSFESPSSRESRYIHQKAAHAYGLYLKSVEYHPADLQTLIPCSETDEDLSPLLKEYKNKVKLTKDTIPSINTKKSDISEPSISQDLSNDHTNGVKLGLLKSLEKKVSNLDMEKPDFKEHTSCNIEMNGIDTVGIETKGQPFNEDRHYVLKSDLKEHMSCDIETDRVDTEEIE